MLQHFSIFNEPLREIKPRKALISTINAHSYNISQKDKLYHQALLNSDALIPDGVSVVWAMKWLTGRKLVKIAGADLFLFELTRLQRSGGKCFFLGSTNRTLKMIEEKMAREYPSILIKTFPPPYKTEFTEEDNILILNTVNDFQPDVLMVGMTAPKQEKWAFQHFNQLKVGHICCVGAVFDFFAGTINRAPQWMINAGLEWLYRLIKEPRRLWRRYLIGNTAFILSIIKEKFLTQYKPIPHKLY